MIPLLTKTRAPEFCRLPAFSPNPQYPIGQNSGHNFSTQKSSTCTKSTSASPSPLARIIFVVICWAATFCLGIHTSASVCFAKEGEVTIVPIDDATGDQVAIRLKIKQANGRTPKLAGLLRRGDWYLLDRPFVVRQRDAEFNFTASRGLEYAMTEGGFTLSRDAADEIAIYVERSCDMRKEDWWSGDLWSEIPRDELSRWMAADDIDLALTITRPLPDEAPATAEAANTEPSTTDENKPTPLPNKPPATRPKATNSKVPLIIDKQTRWSQSASLIDLRPESGLLFHDWKRMETLSPEKLVELPISPRVLQKAIDDKAGHIAIVQPWARDLPIWLAQGRIDSIAVLSHHLQPDKSLAMASAIYNPDPLRFDGPRGLGRLMEYSYWQLLEAGFRIAPAAASGFAHSGLDTHLGYNRVYVSLAGSESEASWWERLKQGKSIVTNGPLLRPLINGELPGATLRAATGEKIELNVSLTLTVRDPVEYLEVMHNGQSLYRARLDEHAKRGGMIPPLEVKESGWVLLRVVTDHEPSYRFAMTAPYYIEIGNQTRITSESVSFFQSWLEQSEKKIAQLPPPEQSAYQPWLDQARQFWQTRAEQANSSNAK